MINCCNGSKQRYFKQEITILWKHFNEEELMTSYCHRCKVFLIFETLIYKFRCLFFDINIPQRLDILQCVAIVPVWVWSVDYVNKICLILPPFHHKWRYWLRVSAFYCFFVGLHYGDGFSNRGRSNDASRTLNVFSFRSNISQTFTLHGVCSFCNAFQS